jgi:hypothetical protein
MTFVQTLTAATYKNRLLLLQQSSLRGATACIQIELGFVWRTVAGAVAIALADPAAPQL